MLINKVSFANLVFFLSLVSQAGEVLVIKQWHLSPGEKTTDIEAGKLRPQFPNQLDIYNKLTELVNERKKLTLIQEGCEGEVTKESSPEHYGWTFEALSKRKNDPSYNDILAFMPVKMKAKFEDKVRAVCSDTKELIQKSLLSISDLRGSTGFYQRLREFRKKNDEKSYKAYEAAAIPKDKLGKVDAIEYQKLKVKESIKNIEDSLNERNDLIVNLVRKIIDENPVVVIGGLHVKDLTQKLQKEKIPFSIYSPKGYDVRDEQLLEKFKEGL